MTNEQESLEQSLETEGFRLASPAPIDLRSRSYWNCIFPNGLTECKFSASGEQLGEILKRHPAQLRLIKASEIDPLYEKSQDCYFVYVKEE